MTKPIKAALILLLCVGLALYLIFGIVRIPKDIAGFERVDVTLFQYRGAFLNPTIERHTIIRADEPEKFQVLVESISFPTYRAYWDQYSASKRGHAGDVAMYQLVFRNGREFMDYIAYDDGTIIINGTMVRDGLPFEKATSAMFNSILEIVTD